MAIEHSIERQEPITINYPREGATLDDRKNLIKGNWAEVQRFTGEGASATQLRDTWESMEEIFTADKDSKFTSEMKRSFERRIKAVERTEWMEELDSSNSHWNETVKLAKEKMGLSRSAVAMSIMTLKDKLSPFVDDGFDNPYKEDMEKAFIQELQIEMKISEMYENYLKSLSDDEARNLKFKDVLPNAIRQTHDGKDVALAELFEELRAESNEELLEEKVQQITADNIPTEVHSDYVAWFIEEDPAVASVQERFATTKDELVGKLNELKNKIKVSAPSLVNGVVKNVRSHVSNINLKVNVARGAAGATGMALAALALNFGTMDTGNQSRIGDSSLPAGVPVETSGSRYIRSEAYGAALEEALAAQADSPATPVSVEKVEQSETETPGPAQQAIREITESTQETPDYSKIEEILAERDFEFKVINGVPSWKPKDGQFWSHFLGAGLGYSDPKMYGETGQGGLLDQYNLRNKTDKPLQAGEWVPVPAGLLDHSEE